MDTKTRTPKVGGRIWHHEPRIAAATVKTNSSCFPHHWLFMSYPCGFVNTCVCTLLSVGSGCRQRHVYRIYEDFKKSKPTCKISLLLFKTKKLMSSRMCQPFCQNVDFLGEAETTVALCCCDGKKQNKNQQQTIMKHKVCLLVGGGGGWGQAKTSGDHGLHKNVSLCFFVAPPRVWRNGGCEVWVKPPAPLCSLPLCSHRGTVCCSCEI